MSELRISFEDGQWYASGEPYEEGAIRASDISITHPTDLTALCEALGLVPRSLVVSALETCMADVDDAMKGVNRSFTDAITRIMWDDDEPEPAKEVQP